MFYAEGDVKVYVIVCSCLLTLIGLIWIKKYGWKRGLLASLARIAWVLPLLTLLFPESLREEITTRLSKTQVHVLLDDSNSMQRPSGLSTPMREASQYVKVLKDECIVLGCELQVAKISEFTDRVKGGKSPIISSLKSFLTINDDSPWVLVSDGGDENPTLIRGKDVSTKSNGLILGVGVDENKNIWLSDLKVPPFNFVDKQFSVSFTLNREYAGEGRLPVQFLVYLDDSSIGAKNATFLEGEKTKNVEFVVPTTPKGQHLLRIKAIPIAGETALWDNEVSTNVETIANTIGVLHLSGAPSADSRFLRRMLKSEPKFDLISFFILRDPFDSQFVNERELSLIPFPVDKLFTDELPNFKLVIIQNFKMLQFLNTEYQRNLVEFVTNGGGLLFVGGPRALSKSDIASISMKKILPFIVDDKPYSPPSNSLKSLQRVQKKSDDYPWYDDKLKFTVDFAIISDKKRELASIYDDLLEHKAELNALQNLAGLHHMENVSFYDEGFTEILVAKSEIGELPLMSASYPGKGRAIWLYTDAFWKAALDSSVSRDFYNQFNQKIFSWLIREDIKKPVTLSSFEIFADDKNTMFNISLLGPAVKYYEHNENWQFDLCGQTMTSKQLEHNRVSDTEVEVTGSFAGQMMDGRICRLNLTAKNKAFGNVKASQMTMVSRAFSDSELPFSRRVLENLSEKVGAKLAFKTEIPTAIKDFLLNEVGTDRFVVSRKNFSRSDPYWFFDDFLIFICLLGIPIEVLVRRWPEITGAAQKPFDDSLSNP